MSDVRHAGLATLDRYIHPQTLDGVTPSLRRYRDKAARGKSILDGD